MQSHILQCLSNIEASKSKTNSTDSTNENQSEQSTYNQILFDLSSIRTDLSNGKYIFRRIIIEFK